MSEVKFFEKTKLSKDEIKDLLKDKFIENELVVVKLHFGEPGNEMAFKAEDIKPYTEAIKELGFKLLMVDTPVAYDSPRNTKGGYEKVIKDRGYGDLGEYTVSDKYEKSKLEGYEFEISKELASAKNVLVISHVKGHECAGFGGAIKNLGMGALSPESKHIVHDSSKPVVEEDICIGCGLCSTLCPAKAISMKTGKSNPDLGKCWGCSICEVNCPVEAIKPNRDIFDKVLALGAISVVNLMPKNTYYFNIIKNITKMCDCESDPGEKIASDIGVLFSDNPVAIDNASIDLINEKEGRDLFKDINHKDPKLQIKYAQEASNFKMDYELNKQS